MVFVLSEVLNVFWCLLLLLCCFATCLFQFLHEQKETQNRIEWISEFGNGHVSGFGKYR